MSFLAPLFLLGALAVALPVLFHLVRRSSRNRMPFSSLMFLRASPPRLSRRSRLEHWLLLLLRAAALALLAVAFARPFFVREGPPPTPSEGAERLLVLLDTSASMRREGLWPAALEKARKALRGAGPLDEVAVYQFGRQFRPVVTFDEWNQAAPSERASLAEQRLAGLRPEWSGTQLGQALMAAAEVASDPAGQARFPRVRLLLVSDLQESGRLSVLQGYEWPNGLSLSLETVHPRRPGNASLHLLTDAPVSAPRTPGVPLRVVNDPQSAKDQFQVGWVRADGNGFAGQPLEVYVPAGQSRTLLLPSPIAGAAADRIRLVGDDEDFDNTVFVSPPRAAVVEVLYLGADREDDPRQPLYYLRRAFQETPRQVVRVNAQRPGEPLLETAMAGADLVVVTDANAVLGRRLREAVAAGKTALYAPRHPAALEGLQAMLDLPTLSAEEVRPPRPVILAEIDFRHPLFAPFADPRYSDFSRIHFWQYRRLSAGALPAARVLAQFDSGDPALVEIPVARGRVFVLPAGWHPEDSQLALSSKFVPLLYAMVEQSGAPPPPPVQFFVGDPVPLTTLRTPGPVEVQFEAVTTRLESSVSTFLDTAQPGLRTARAGAESFTFAVNLDPAESRTRPLTADDLETLGVPLWQEGASAAARAASRLQAHRSELEGHQKLWRWLVLACVGVLLVETWLAGRTGRVQLNLAKP